MTGKKLGSLSAYPCYEQGARGLTKREYFAAQAWARFTRESITDHELCATADELEELQDHFTAKRHQQRFLLWRRLLARTCLAEVDAMLDELAREVQWLEAQKDAPPYIHWRPLIDKEEE